MRKPRAAWRTSTLGQLAPHDEAEIVGYGEPVRPRTLEEFWAEHARHGVVYRRDDFGAIALAECEECYGAMIYLSDFGVVFGGLFFEIDEEG